MGYEEGDSNLAFDNANGIIGTHYLSFPEWDINISGYTSQPPYDVLVDTLNAALGSSGNDGRWHSHGRLWPPR